MGIRIRYGSEPSARIEGVSQALQLVPGEFRGRGRDVWRLGRSSQLRPLADLTLSRARCGFESALQLDLATVPGGWPGRPPPPISATLGVFAGGFWISFAGCGLVRRGALI